MFKYVLILLICFISSNAFSLTNIILLRHAEKKSGYNPGLTSAGKKRAKSLIQLSKTYEITALYSSNYKRTKQTLKPLSNHLNLEINTSFNEFDFTGMLQDISSHFNNSTVVIAGHSHTIPDFINFLSPDLQFDGIEYDDFSNLFLIHYQPDKNATILRFTYQPQDSENSLKLYPRKF